MSVVPAERYIGLMSGTSIDAIDAVLVQLPSGAAPEILATHSHAIDPGLRRDILAVASGAQDDLDSCARLDRRLGQAFAETALALLDHSGYQARQIRAIGSHGQTVRHCPDGAPAYSVQLADPATIATLTGIDVVADFRRHDIAAGGQGAPLVPAFHAALWRHERDNRVILNLGGMSNITWLPAAADIAIGGLDCGPGNVLLDSWIRRCRGERLDNNGDWAASGQVIPELLATMLEDPFFRRPPPRSTGREYFNLDWLMQHLPADQRWPDNDIQATLAELTAASVGQAIKDFCPLACDEMIVCGGGANNRDLCQRLQRHGRYRLVTSELRGMAPQWVEACAFAWLARETLAGRPGNVPEVTGASRALVLGGIYCGR